MSTNHSRISVSVMALAAMWAVLTAAALVARPLLPVDETRYLAVAWEMWQRGDFLVPYLNGEPYSHKPPLLFWGMHLGWALFGVNDWTPRLVAPLFGLGALLLTFRLGRLLWPDMCAAGSAAGFILIGALFWTLFTTMTMFDMMHAFFVLLGAIGLVVAARGQGLGGFGLFALAVGLGIVAKGPAILVHLLPAALAAPLWAPGLGWSGRWAGWYLGLVAGVLLGAAIGLAWALPAGFAGGEEYRTAIFWGQSAGRMVDSFAHGRPFWWFAAILPGMMLPWTIWPAAWRAIRRGGRALFADPGVRFCAIWFTAAFLVFSAISGKQPHYLLPEFPALALLLARALTGAAALEADGADPFWRPWDRWVPAGLAGLLAAVLAGMFLFDIKPSWATSVGEVHVWPLSVVVLLALAFLCAPAKATVCRAAGIAGLSVALIVAVHFTLRPLMAESHDFGPLARKMKTFEDRGYDFVTFGKYHGQYHFLGRLTRPFGVVDGPRELDAWLKDHPKSMIVSLHKRLPKGAEPDAISRFRGRVIGVWRSEVYPPRVTRLDGS